MANDTQTGEAHEMVPGIPAPIQRLPSDVMQVSEQLILLVWLAFGIALAVLHKLLWKPILQAVEKREDAISDALDGAEKARQELAETQTRSRQIVDRATGEARAVTDQAAQEASAALARADREAKALARRRFDEAEREIEVEARKATEQVRLDAAKNLGDMIERLLTKNLTDEQRRAYQADILNEVKL